MALVLAPVVAQAQRVQCDLVSSRQVYSVGGGAVRYIGGPVFHCTDGTNINADSAVYVESTGRIDFMGNVHFDERERTLTSGYAQYVGRERRLMAQVNVLLKTKKDGSTLRAGGMDYFQKSPTNPQDRIEAFNNRPHATLYRQRTTTPGGVDTTLVDADRMRIVGEQAFQGWGNVQMKRGTMTSKSGYANFDQTGNYMHLTDKAVVQSDTFKLSADTIDANLVNGDEFKDVRANKNAHIESQDVKIDAPAVRIVFDKGNVERLIAVGGVTKAGPAPQAVAKSKEFTLVADSIDALSPNQKLEKVIAVGIARGERTGDITDAKLPDLIARDWVRGDTVIAYFGQAPKDTARVLERIAASGSPASSTYRMKETKTKTDTTEMSVNYLTAQHIDVVLKDGAVDHVHAEGDIRGLYLQKPKSAANATAKPAKQ